MPVCLQLEWSSYRPGSWEPQRFLFQQLPLLSPFVRLSSLLPLHCSHRMHSKPRSGCISLLYISSWLMWNPLTVQNDDQKEDHERNHSARCHLSLLQMLPTDARQKTPIHFRLFTCLATVTIATMTGVQISEPTCSHFYIFSHMYFFSCLSVLFSRFSISSFFSTCALCWCWNTVFGYYWFLKKDSEVPIKHTRNHDPFFPACNESGFKHLHPSATMFKSRNASVCWWQTFKAGFPKLMFDIYVLNEGHLS